MHLEDSMGWVDLGSGLLGHKRARQREVGNVLRDVATMDGKEHQRQEPVPEKHYPPPSARALSQ